MTDNLKKMEETCLDDGPAVNFETATLEIANADRKFYREFLLELYFFRK